MENKILNLIKDIDNILSRAGDKGYDGISLHLGKAGYLVFLCHYYKLSQKEELIPRIDSLSDEIIETVFSKDLPLNFTHGVFGSMWGLKYSNELLDSVFFDEAELAESDHDMLEAIKSLLSGRVNDFMHGGLGGILAINSALINENSAELFDSIVDSSQFEKTGLYLWLDFMDGDNNEHYNLGLAHGQPAYWYFLNYLAQINPKLKSRALEIITESYRIVKKFQFNTDSFPSYGAIGNGEIIANDESSRLSWCYGDLSLANTLILIGKELNSDFLLNEGLALAIRTTKRDAFDKAGVIDLCLCHGAASCITIYTNLFYLTGEMIFKDASEKWIQLAIDFYQTDSVRFYEPEKVAPANYNTSMLNGYVGLGLSLISALDGDLRMWNRCLLLN